MAGMPWATQSRTAGGSPEIFYSDISSSSHLTRSEDESQMWRPERTRRPESMSTVRMRRPVAAHLAGGLASEVEKIGQGLTLVAVVRLGMKAKGLLAVAIRLGHYQRYTRRGWLGHRHIQVVYSKPATKLNSKIYLQA